MAADAERPRDDPVRGVRQEAREGVAVALARVSAAGLARMTPPALLALLSAGALTPLALVAPDQAGLAWLGVATGVGTNVLSQVIGNGVAALRRRTAAKEPAAREVEQELAERIEDILATDTAQARQLRIALAAVLREIDAASIALELAVDSGNRTLQTQINAAFVALSGEFAEFGFLLTGIDRAASEIQRTLLRQDAERRHDRSRMRMQSAQLMLIREELALLRRDRSAGAHTTRWDQGSPYRGLLPFEADHVPIFHGREQVTRLLLGKLSERLSEQSVVMVTGVSGVGKSSLLRAGLLPALAREMLPVAGSARWPCLLLTPTRAPLEELAAHLAALSHLDPVTVRRSLADHPADAHLLLRQAVLASDAGEAARMVLVVDQFEEVFTLVEESAQREAFITALTSMATTPMGPEARAPALVVIGVRGDFLDRCAAYPVLAEGLQEGQVVVGPMTEPELRSAITSPAAAADLQLEPGLADAVLDELGSRDGYGAGVLPLLSQAMLATWENREGDLLTVRGYGRGGGVWQAVQTSAEAVFSGLTEEERATARRLFQRMTVVSGDGRLARRRLPKSQLGEPVADAVVDAFATKRLIVVHGTTVEIAHDCLLRAWPRLREWLEDDQAGRILYGQLLADAGDWERHGRDSSFLYRGTRLAAVRQARAGWEADPGRYPPLERTVAEFFAASIRAAGHRRRWIRLGIAVLSGLTLVASIAAVAAVRFAGEAENRSLQALSRQLSTQSTVLRDTDPVAAALLAVAAWRIAHTDEARHSMLNALAAPSRGVLAGHAGRVTSLAFNHDGNMLASTGEDLTVRLWDVGARRQIGDPLPGHKDIAGKLTFSNDGTTLAGSGDNGVVLLWDVAARKQIGRLEHGGGIEDLAFSPDGGILATAGNDGTIRLWKVSSGKQIGQPMRHGRSTVYAVAIDPGGEVVAGAGNDGTVSLWNMVTHKQIGRRIAATGYQTVQDVTFSPDGTMLATGAQDGTARLWSTATHEQIGASIIVSRDNQVSEVAFSPDGTTLATEDYGGGVRLWSTTTHEPLGEPLTDPNEKIFDVAFSPDGSMLATAANWIDYDNDNDNDSGHGNGVVRLWDPTMFRPTGPPLAGPNGSIGWVAFSPDGTTLATAGRAKALLLWDLAGRRQIGPLSGLGDWPWAMAFNHDGTLVAGAARGTVRLWRTATRTQIGAPLAATRTSILDLAFSPSGTTLAVADQDGIVGIWDVTTRKRVGAPIKAAPLDVHGLSFSRDGTMLATLGGDRTAALWDTATYRRIGDLSGMPTVHELVFSPDGSTLAGAAEDGTVRLWRVATRVQDGPPLIVSRTVQARSVAFSPDGTVLATRDDNGVVRLWDTMMRRQVGMPLTSRGGIGSMAFSPDGTLLATTTDDDTVQLWNVGFPADPVSALCALAARPLSEQEWHQYLPDEQPYQRVCP
ncbi:hypothetical protein GCM10022226_19210 [Sphaerisporangium flaviroseum]|uniref:Novel STAND NTPase 1 domain-containing protein n=1 Tax=Sphaerisporangium flaviroseum TaxID=509199 RepID=A0ABP7HTJ6_9ACTN